MDTLSNGALIVVIQNMQLALDYQYRKLDQDEFDEEEAADVEEYLVTVELILGEIKAEYTRRATRGTPMSPVTEIPRIDL